MGVGKIFITFFIKGNYWTNSDEHAFVLRVQASF